MFIAMHQNTKANSFYVKTYLARNLILKCVLIAAKYSPQHMHHLPVSVMFTKNYSKQLLGNY